MCSGRRYTKISMGGVGVVVIEPVVSLRLGVTPYPKCHLRRTPPRETGGPPASQQDYGCAFCNVTGLYSLSRFVYCFLYSLSYVRPVYIVLGLWLGIRHNLDLQGFCSTSSCAMLVLDVGYHCRDCSSKQLPLGKTKSIS